MGRKSRFMRIERGRPLGEHRSTAKKIQGKERFERRESESASTEDTGDDEASVPRPARSFSRSQQVVIAEEGSSEASNLIRSAGSASSSDSIPSRGSNRAFDSIPSSGSNRASDSIKSPHAGAASSSESIGARDSNRAFDSIDSPDSGRASESTRFSGSVRSSVSSRASVSSGSAGPTGSSDAITSPALSRPSGPSRTSRTTIPTISFTWPGKIRWSRSPVHLVLRLAQIILSIPNPALRWSVAGLYGAVIFSLIWFFFVVLPPPLRLIVLVVYIGVHLGILRGRSFRRF